MAVTLETDWKEVEDGDVTTLDLQNALNVNWAEIKWKGVDRTETNILYETNSVEDTVSVSSSGSESESPSIPSTPSGYEFYEHYFFAYIQIGPAEPDTSDLEIYGETEGNVILDVSKFLDSKDYIEDSNTVDEEYTNQTFNLDYSCGADNWEYHYLIETEGRKVTSTTYNTQDPQVTIGTSTTNYTGSLNDGEETAYITLAGLTAGEINDIEHIISGSEIAEYKIQYNIDQTIPVLKTPVSGTETEDTQPTFEIYVPEDPDNTVATDSYHAKIIFSENSAMTDVIYEYESKENQTGWEYYDTDTSSWEDVPPGGFPADSDVRLTIQDELSPGLVYWTAKTYEGNDTYGDAPSPNSIRIQYQLAEDEGYKLIIEDTEWDAYSIEVTRTSNGELANFNFEVNNENGDAETAINWNDSVNLIFKDFQGLQQELTGRVREKNVDGHYLNVTAQLGDRILTERIIKEDYADIDLGKLVRNIIRDYGAPLTVENVRDIGISASIPTDNKKIINVLEKLRKDYQIQYFIDSNLDVHLYTKDDIDRYYNTVKYGDV
ncbi:MAG: hypothetical protein ACQEQD_04430 [Bacillota bacterium]